MERDRQRNRGLFIGMVLGCVERSGGLEDPNLSLSFSFGPDWCAARSYNTWLRSAALKGIMSLLGA